MSKLCIYHHNCADGFGAAWVVRRKYGEDAQFHPGVYQMPPPDVKGQDVILVDFSYKRPVMEQLCDAANSVIVLDHHKSAEEDLRGLNGYSVNVGSHFDMNRSGAGMTWDYYFPDEPRPQLIDHIEDRDLWRFKLPGTREIQANVFSYPYDFKVWDNLMAADPLDLFAAGAAIERKHHKDIAELVNACMMRMTIAGYAVPVANLPYIFSSDAGHLMSEGEPFAACFWDTPAGRIFSLRSREEGGIDVSEIAKKYGGGGHKHAAGFRIDHGVNP